MTPEQLFQASDDLQKVMSSLVSLMRDSWTLQLSNLVLAIPLGFFVCRRVVKIFHSFF